MEKDKARMAEVFLQLDADADGMWVLAPRIIHTHKEETVTKRN